MKLLYLTDRLSHRGGAPHHLLDLISAMAEDHQVTVAAANKDSDVVLPEGVRFARCPGLRRSTDHLGGLDKLPNLLASADVVHIQNVMNPAALRQASGPRAVVTIQDHRVFCPGPGKTLTNDQACDQPMSEQASDSCFPASGRRTEMLTLTRARLNATKRAHRLVVLSQYMADELAQTGAEGAVVIPPPVTLGPPKTEPGEHFLIAGRLVHHKGTELGIQAFELAQPACELHVAGLGGADLVTAKALGLLDREDLRASLRRSRALLFPARWQEPFGIVGVEALSVGTPVIAMSRGGMGEWTDKGTITVQGVDDMATALTRLRLQPDEALELGKNGQKMAAERFSPVRHHAAMKAVYNTI